MNRANKNVEANDSFSNSEPLKSATEEEREQLFDELAWFILPSASGGTDRQVHIPKDRESTDRSNVETICYHSGTANTASRLRRKPADAYPNRDRVSFCDYCVARWREGK